MATDKSPPDGSAPTGGSSFYFRRFVASGLASCFSDASVAPLERVKILFQGQHPNFQTMGMREGMRQILKDEGFRGLYRGNGAMMLLSFPYSAVQFTAYDETKKFIRKQKGTRLSQFDKLVAGTVAGATATVTTYPMELIRTRLTFQTKGQETYSGIYDSIKSISAKEGLRGFYKGLTPTLMAGTPYAAFSYYCYEMLKTMAMQNAPTFCAKPSEADPEQIVLKTSANIICGGLSGAMTQAAVYPLDVAGSQMQVAAILDDNTKPKSMFQTFRHIYREHGIWGGLYRGLSVISGDLLCSSLQRKNFKNSIKMATDKSSPDGSAPTGGSSFYARRFVASGLASCFSDASVAPLERVKILFQGQHPNFQTMGMREGMRRILKDEGFRGLYRGNGAMMLLSFPYSAVQFTAFDETKKEGLRGFSKGLTPTLMAGTPYAAFSYYCYEMLKTVAMQNAPTFCAKPSEADPEQIVLKTPANIICGGLSGAMTQAAVYPLDVAGSQMQVAAILDDNTKPKSMFQTFRHIYREHGIWGGLYRGLSVSFLRAIPSSAVFFTTHELLRQAFSLNR